MGVGVMIGYFHSFPLVVKVFRKWFGCFEVCGRSCRTCRFVISSKRVAPGGILLRGGGRGNDNRQNRFLGGKLGQVSPGHRLGMRTKYFFCLEKPCTHVTKLESWFD